MNPDRRIIIFLLLPIFVAEVFFAQAAFAESGNSSLNSSLTRQELTDQIQLKAKQLDDINNRIESTKRSLEGVQGERKTLQKELRILQNNVNQLNLSIRADEISIQKLNLEVDSLSYDLKDITSSIQDKKSAIESTIVELQKNDHISSNLLLAFLKNRSLADSALEAQALSNLQNQLSVDIDNLGVLHDEYNKKIGEASVKRQGISSRKQDLTNKKAIVQDQKNEREQLLQVTKNKEGNFERQISELEKQQRQIAQEVETLDAVLRTKIDPATLPPLKPGVLAMPIATSKAAVTQDYGATQFARFGYQGKWHNGIDMGAPVGTPVLAAEDGTVVATGNQDLYCRKGAYGKFIVIKHNNNLVTLYAHMSRQIVQRGDTVYRGGLIGYSGRTGYATGPHLHFTVYAGPTFYMGPSKVCGQMPYGGDLNPLGYL